MSANSSIKSILVAVDLTESSSEVLRSAADLALASGAQLNIVHAHEEPALAVERDLLASQRKVHEKRKGLMDALGADLPRSVAVGTVRVQIGSAADVILAESRETEADVIILGVHRNRGIADRLLGSTAELVLRHAGVPCLLLNGPLQVPTRRIVVPSDLSAAAKRALVAALEWAEAICPSDGDISIAHVLDTSVEVETAPWAEQEIQTDLLTAASEGNREAGTSLPVTPIILRGDDPVRSLLDHAQAVSAGLIVMGTHGDGMLVRALLGSVSSAMVRRSPLPVLLVPRAAVGAAAERTVRSAAAAYRTEPLRL
jgi:nucleotide-binding universal stress UspA family protein